MLEPRETDLPGLFFVLVFLPLVAYVLLGKWSEVSKKKERISELAYIAAEETFRVEAMAVVPIIPVLKLNNVFHKCTRCFGPARTRCSRCKSVRYCSGKCQIIHWRQFHKQECQQSHNSASNEASIDENLLLGEKSDSSFIESNNFYKFTGEMSRRDDNATLEPCSTSYDNITPSKGTFVRHKVKWSHPVLAKEEIPEKNNVTSNFGRTDSEKSTHMDSSPSVPKKDVMKTIGLKRSSKHERVKLSDVNGDRHKKIKMLFPYEEFVKFFRYEAFDLLPRGLVNCGNSCYANAVLQCLTSTKPLTIYLLHQSHSRACCTKTWCLICELEHHVLMLKDNREPLSLLRILVNMRSVNNRIGDGSQEDAHEFLRLLVTSMQSICLEGLGGDSVVEPRLQETTIIQHMFGGQLRSRVKCLRCHRESDRYENIMDLTLEIYGWVESLEDALTQFTSPEDLEGENMYRCGRCAVYVRAQKQLAIQEAPNILTIVLKRFKGGNYGKINKCITFPDMLDMIPFMTGTDDVPPLYMLYGVVVHLDTMNASFYGHYISYVKDLQGDWFRIDDTQVRPVPLSQVMSEGAYILFYARSSPRPAKTHTGKPKLSTFGKHQTQKSTKVSRGSTLTGPSSSHDFSDAASSDWSICTSSDDVSFTTESTRDSFSTIDYENDPISSIFNVFCATPDYTVSCNRFSRSGSHTVSKGVQKV